MVLLRLLCACAAAAVAAAAPPHYVRVLQRWSGNAAAAEHVANAVDRWATRRNLDPAVVLGIIHVENRELKPRAVSKDGSVGVMQVQPRWRASFARQCGRNLFDIDTNVCFGTAVLALNVTEAATLEGALLRYNGCVSRKSRCRRYARLVLQAAEEARNAD